jgi:hypothetical protein
MAKVHWVLQGKGGVGKSLVATLLAQYKTSKGHPPLCIDTDPINATLGSFKALNVRRLTILRDEQIDPRRFDELVDWLVGSHRDCIVDTGSSAFVPLMHYLVQNQVPALLRDLGLESTIHTVLVGGQASGDTLASMKQVLQQFPDDVQLVAWLNPYWGPVEHLGLDFHRRPAHESARSRGASAVTLPTLQPETSGQDFREMLRTHFTFDEALAQEGIPIMTRQRLRLVRDQIMKAIDAAGAALQ